eukprot:TRINITY_DN49082_c0_g1_i1.p1 TRINITY_DN49082_c0_g1~~TRINITY_DN49082_c0_g1_i1.p1  ORF type:complete len:345 (-),score=68.92 TRINITY_DN49082_c0_g1_i1:7-1041(-)
MSREGCCALWLPKKRRHCTFQALEHGYCVYHKGGQLAQPASPRRKTLRSNTDATSADVVAPPERRRASLDWNPAAGAPALPAAVLSPRLCVCDALARDLAELVCEALGLPRDAQEEPPSQLSRLHLLPEGVAAQTRALGRHDAFSKRWTAALERKQNPDFRRRLDDCVRRFVTKYVAESVDATAHGWEHFVYQAEPSLRVHMPHTRPGIQKHKDFDYYHQPTELNFWIPLVPRVWGSNSLYCESAPGRGDFAAFEAECGQFFRFWGNQCEHYTTRNDTDVTRVSIDVRVIPMKLFEPAFASPKGSVPFRLGQYYTSTCADVNADDGKMESGFAAAPRQDTMSEG